MTRYIALDTETTGFSARHHRVIEFGAVEVTPRTGFLGAELRHLIDPGGPIPANATAVHGIRAEDVRGKPRFRDVASEISAFIADSVLVIQNAEFDVSMLDAEFARAGCASVMDTVARVVDLLDITAGVHPFMASRTLDAVCEHYAISLADRTMHGALLDSKLMAQTLPRLAYDYDRWKAIVEDRCAVEVADFCGQLDAFTDRMISGVDMRTAEKCEASYTRLAAAEKTISKLRKRFDESLDELLAADAQWSCKHFAAYWKPSGRTSWKDVAIAYLSSSDLEKYAKYATSATYTPTADASVIAEGEKLSVVAAENVISSSISCVSRAINCLRAADKRIEKSREAVRTQILSLVDAGYSLKLGTFKTGSRKTFSYKEACEDLCPDADKSEFISQSKSVAVVDRDSKACEELFS